MKIIEIPFTIFQEQDAEIEEYKKRIAQLESIATQVESLKTQRVKDAEDVNVLKTESEQTLTKAKGVIFEKVKIIKNQELQIEAYSQQIESLKDVVRITKDLLEIRNLEVKQLENKINCMEEKMKAEKERQDLLHKKLEMMIRHNGELKREYETQLCLFNALRDRYSERELAKGVIDDMKKDVEAERVRVQEALGNALNGVPVIPEVNGHNEANKEENSHSEVAPKPEEKSQPEETTKAEETSQHEEITKAEEKSQTEGTSKAEENSHSPETPKAD